MFHHQNNKTQFLSHNDISANIYFLRRKLSANSIWTFRRKCLNGFRRSFLWRSPEAANAAGAHKRLFVEVLLVSYPTKPGRRSWFNVSTPQASCKAVVFSIHQLQLRSFHHKAVLLDLQSLFYWWKEKLTQWLMRRAYYHLQMDDFDNILNQLSKDGFEAGYCVIKSKIFFLLITCTIRMYLTLRCLSTE